MSHTITIRLTKELAQWLEETAAKSGRAQGQIVREQLERAKRNAQDKPFMRLAGTVAGARDLSRRKGFSKP
jgi:predicted DNA-binding protein